MALGLLSTSMCLCIEMPPVIIAIDDDCLAQLKEANAKPHPIRSSSASSSRPALVEIFVRKNRLALIFVTRTNDGDILSSAYTVGLAATSSPPHTDIASRAWEETLPW